MNTTTASRAAAIRPQPSHRVVAFYCRDTRHFCYVLSDTQSGECAIIDPAANYLACEGQLHFHDAETVVQYVRNQSLTLRWIIETDAHTQHFSAAVFLRQHLGGKLVISRGVNHIPSRLQASYPGVALTVKGFDCLLDSNDTLALGEERIKAVTVSGCSPAAMLFLMADCLFTGSSLCIPDNTMACGGSPLADPEKIQASLASVLVYPDTLRVFVGRDSAKTTRSLEYETSIKALRNAQFTKHPERGNCQQKRYQYGADLCPLFWPALQWNLNAQLPEHGLRYITQPLHICS